MSEQFEEIFNKLQYASPVKAKQILRELEANPDEFGSILQTGKEA